MGHKSNLTLAVGAAVVVALAVFGSATRDTGYEDRLVASIASVHVGDALQQVEEKLDDRLSWTRISRDQIDLYKSIIDEEDFMIADLFAFKLRYPREDYLYYILIFDADHILRNVFTQKVGG